MQESFSMRVAGQQLLILGGNIMDWRQMELVHCYRSISWWCIGPVECLCMLGCCCDPMLRRLMPDRNTSRLFVHHYIVFSPLRAADWSFQGKPMANPQQLLDSSNYPCMLHKKHSIKHRLSSGICFWLRKFHAVINHLDSGTYTIKAAFNEIRFHQFISTQANQQEAMSPYMSAHATPPI